MKFKICRSSWEKARGLMFYKKRNLIFIFDKVERISLHMWFVFFPIDVLFLDSDKKIVEIKKDFKPFTFYRSKTPAKYVVELSDTHNYKIGEIFDLPDQ